MWRLAGDLRRHKKRRFCAGSFINLKIKLVLSDSRLLLEMVRTRGDSSTPGSSAGRKGSNVSTNCKSCDGHSIHEGRLLCAPSTVSTLACSTVHLHVYCHNIQLTMTVFIISFSCCRPRTEEGSRFVFLRCYPRQRIQRRLKERKTRWRQHHEDVAHPFMAKRPKSVSRRFFPNK